MAAIAPAAVHGGDDDGDEPPSEDRNETGHNVRVHGKGVSQTQDVADN